LWGFFFLSGSLSDSCMPNSRHRTQRAALPDLPSVTDQPDVVLFYVGFTKAVLFRRIA
jgi:hypothetical protein